MRIAIVHYHLESGGVTRVIESALISLQSHDLDVVVLSGEHYSGRQFSNVREVDGLSYIDSFGGVTPEILARNLVHAAREGLAGEVPDIWHIHNHSLGKNIILPQAIQILLEKGHRFLFQIHDFAEDGRPDNYQILLQGRGEKSLDSIPENIYPIASQIHYAALNSRDLKFLKLASIPENQLHFLPNPIAPSQFPGKNIRRIDDGNEGRLFLYPTRAIRRKNIGEFILWSALAEENDLFATTLTPVNRRWKMIHDRWTAFAHSLKLPIQFGVVEKTDYSFDEWIENAYSLVTTSVAEGFGLAFLEPWAKGKQLQGRNLPEITVDYSDAGIDLTNLYDDLRIPRELIDTEYLKKELEQTLINYFEYYHKPLSSEAMARALSAIESDEGIDFGYLNETMQETIIKKVISSDNLRELLTPASLEAPINKKIIEKNKKCVAESFSLESYGERLFTIYEMIAASVVEKPRSINAEILLECFLNSSRFYLLRS